MNEQIYSQIESLQSDIANKRKEILTLRSQAEPEPVADYTLQDAGGKDLLLSSLFDDRDELLVIHNMGKGCKYCTLWADGFNGVTKPLADRVPFVLISPDTPEVQREFAAGRGWAFPMLSAAKSTFTQDLGFYKEGEGYWPGVSALIRKDGKIYRASYDFFGPGDVYSSVWHFYDLLPKKVNGWQPKYEYKPF
ncbi:MAG: hypothetical protein JWO03_2581 [Bacteroidetes bacterium]|nr:hypothetical protein [Bacteroidota bacterium]